MWSFQCENVLCQLQHNYPYREEGVGRTTLLQGGGRGRRRFGRSKGESFGRGEGRVLKGEGRILEGGRKSFGKGGENSGRGKVEGRVLEGEGRILEGGGDNLGKGRGEFWNR